MLFSSPYPTSQLLPMPQPPPLSICCLAYVLASGGTSLRMLPTVSQGTACGTEPQQPPEVSNNQATLGGLPSFPVSLPPSPCQYILESPSKATICIQWFTLRFASGGAQPKTLTYQILVWKGGKKEGQYNRKNQYKTKHTACRVFKYNLGITESWIRKYKLVIGSYTD